MVPPASSTRKGHQSETTRNGVDRLSYRLPIDALSEGGRGRFGAMSGWQRHVGGLVAAGAVAVGIGMGLGACSSSSNDDAGTTTTTVATATTNTTGTSPSGTAGPGTSLPATSAPGTSAGPAPTPTPAPTVTTAPAPAPTTPEEFAAELYRAWRTGDADAAAKVASPEAVQSLFAFEPADFTLQDCQGAAGSTICTYTAGVGSIEMRVRNATGGLPVLVTSVKVTPS
jgi:hypothetical protein